MKLMTLYTSDRSGISRQAGFTIIENLIAISLLGIILASNARLIISSMQANHSARSYGALVSDVQKKIDTYRTSTYSQLLDNFGTNHSAITDGQTASINSSSKSDRATFVTTFTAYKSSNTGLPEAVKVAIAATHRRGKFANVAYNFETVIAQTR